MRLPTAAALAAVVACGTATTTAARTASSPSPTVRPLAAGPLAPGRFVTSTVRRSFSFTIDDGAVWRLDAQGAGGFTLHAASATMRVVAFPRGATSVAALLRAFRTTPGLTKSADEVTKPVDGNDARHLTWRVSRNATVRIGGETFAFRTGDRNHAIVVAAPNAPVLVLMAARNTDYDTVYEKGHLVVFSMDIGP